MDGFDRRLPIDLVQSEEGSEENKEEQNGDTVRAINRSLKQDHLPTSGIAP
jgi:hypothetical protein